MLDVRLKQWVTRVTRLVVVDLGTHCNVGSKRECCPLQVTLNGKLRTRVYLVQ